VSVYLEIICATQGSFRLWFNDYLVGNASSVEGRFIYCLDPFLKKGLNWMFFSFDPLFFECNNVIIRVFRDVDSIQEDLTCVDFSENSFTCSGFFDTRAMPELAIPDAGFEFSGDLNFDPVWLEGSDLSLAEVFDVSSQILAAFRSEDLGKILSLVSPRRKDYDDFCLSLSYFFDSQGGLPPLEDMSIREVYPGRLYLMVSASESLESFLVRKVPDYVDVFESMPLFIGSTVDGPRWVI